MKRDTLQAGPTKRYLKVGASAPACMSQSAERPTAFGASLRAALEDVSLSPHERRNERRLSMTKMKANVFEGVNRIAIKLKEVPKPGYNEALVRVTLTTICGTDLHILKGEYPVKAGLTIGH
jgi:hypothetical protein